MRNRPSPSQIRRAVLLTAFVAAGCASSAKRADDTVAEPEGRETPHSVLGATTPAAARTGQDPPEPADAGATERPGRLLIYSAITGHVPLRDQGYDPADRYRSPEEREAARARSIEAEIEEEIARQEELSVNELSRAQTSPPTPEPTDPAANPLSAPPAPELRQMPDSLFEREQVTIPPGQWQNKRTLHLERRSLDADDDGTPEEVRYVDPESGAVVRSEQDLDYDGSLDSWTIYENGEPTVRSLDTDGDGRPDAWERYSDGRANARTLDGDADGVKDTFYRYEDAQLVEKRRDANNDGTIDRVESYRDRHRTRTEEDRSLNGWMDTWTTFRVVDGREVVASVERDSRDRGKPDIFETYETRDGETRLKRREEDVNGDGKIDVISIYEDGKLVQRAISDEALSPL